MAMNKKIRLGINGFGRIGRVAFRSWYQKYQDQVEICAINTSGSMETVGWSHLLKYDSTYGRFPDRVEPLEPKSAMEIGQLLVGNKKIPLLGQRDPGKIPWRKFDVDLVIDCTGVFRDRSVEGHFKGGAKKIIISAPPKADIPIFLIGVNANRYKGETVVSNGSCTTNCVAPLIKLIDQKFGFKECIMTTIHAYTAGQNIVDGSHKDLRRARAAAVNIVPTGTGAAKAVVSVYPEVEGRFAAGAVRVPVVVGSYAELVFKLNRKTTKDAVNQVIEEAAAEELVEVVKISYEPLVSSDIVGNSASAIVDSTLTTVISDDMVKISAWYDNEYGYSCRLLELATLIGK